jgi:hypothetical protein
MAYRYTSQLQGFLFYHLQKVDNSPLLNNILLIYFFQRSKNHAEERFIHGHFHAVFVNAWCAILDRANAMDARGCSDNFQFGSSVSMSDEFAVVGVRYATHDVANAGCAYVYQWDGADWTECAILYASDYETNAYFGTSVSVWGNYIIVGSPGNLPTAKTRLRVYLSLGRQQLERAGHYYTGR